MRDQGNMPLLRRHHRWGPTMLWSAAGLALLMSAALWNGFPLLYPDSVDYLRQPFTGAMPEWRTAAYGVFAGVGRLSGSLWAVPLLQSGIILAVLHLSVSLLFPGGTGGRPWLLLAACGIGGLPLYAGQIMADALAGAAILGLLALMLPGREAEVRLKACLAMLTAIAVAVHTSHVAVALGLLLLGLLLRLCGAAAPRLPRPALAAPTAASALGILLAVGANWWIAGRPSLTQTATVQMLGLYVENGLAKRWLDETCPRPDAPPLRLCAWRNRLPDTANMFLWGPDSPRDALGGWDGLRDEARAVVAGATRAYPLELLLSSARLAAWQFVWVDPGDGLIPVQSFMRTPIVQYYPEAEAAFLAAEQQSRLLDFSALVWPTRILSAALVAMLALAAILAALRGRQREAVVASMVIAALVGNAVVGGALSNPNRRYQGRLVWLEAVSLVLMASALRRRPDEIAAAAVRQPPRASLGSGTEP